MIIQMQLLLAKMSLLLIALAATTMPVISENQIQEIAIESVLTEEIAEITNDTDIAQKPAEVANFAKKGVFYEEIGNIKLPLTLKKACSCESWGTPEKEPRQFNFDGSILWGNHPTIRGATTTDVGACQIALSYHKEETEKLGLDVINSFEDNLEFALRLYNRNGMSPWNASKKCWNR
mgnify:CR=1 FL=1